MIEQLTGVSELGAFLFFLRSLTEVGALISGSLSGKSNTEVSVELRVSETFLDVTGAADLSLRQAQGTPSGQTRHFWQTQPW
jgi:hypothetical protein